MANEGIMFSIIIPVYDVEFGLFDRCISSILAQKINNYELILVDDGSSNGCSDVCDKYASVHEQISVIHKLNGGVSSARNTGIERAQGKWILFVDADDWIDESALENISAIVEQSIADVVFFGYYRNYPKREVKIGCSTYSNNQLIMENTKVDLLKKTIAASIYGEPASQATTFRSACASAYKNDFLVKTQIQFPVDMAIGEDLIFRLYTTHYASVIQYSEYCYYHYRKHIIAAQSVSVKFNESIEERILYELYQIQMFITDYKYDDLEEAYIFRAIELITVLFRSYFFHRDNPRSFWQRRRQAKNFLKENDVKRKLSPELFKKLPIKRKCQVILLFNNMFATYLLIYRLFEQISNIK